MEWWKADRASTHPSMMVTVTHAAIPLPRAPSVRLAADPMQVVRIALPAIQCRDHEWLLRGRKSHMCEERGVKHAMDDLGIVRAYASGPGAPRGPTVIPTG
jgi:hypothetical protein